LSRLSSLYCASRSYALILFVMVDQLFITEPFAVDVMWKPKIFISVWQGMSMIVTDVSQGPTAMPFDFRMLTCAPDAASKLRNAPCSTCMSLCFVTNIVTSSAYATTALFGSRCLILRSVSLFSRVHSNGFRHRA